jgi:vancomycin resistance protein VanW
MDLEIGLRAMLRHALDLITTTYFDFPQKKKLDAAFTNAIRLSQEIKPSETIENKKYNLALASAMINEYVIMPGGMFSFWHVIGDPKKRFKKGRAIIRGKLSEEVGGGLCQVSGLLYHVSLLAGLEIIERHNHSIDLYTDETRYTPLGTDATVVYGYKDLRIKNNNPFPVSFQLSQREDTIEVQLLSPQLLHQHLLRYNIVKKDATTFVQVMDEDGNIVGQSTYKFFTS